MSEISTTTSEAYQKIESMVRYRQMKLERGYYELEQIFLCKQLNIKLTFEDEIL